MIDSGGPSDKAVQAAIDALAGKAVPHSYARRAVGAIHPVIRTEVITEIVAALRAQQQVRPHGGSWGSAADLIEREFSDAS